MKRFFDQTVAFVSVLTMVTVAAPASGQSYDEIGIARGSTPGAVQVESLDGAPVDLGAYFGGKPLLLEFWATWCENCEALLPTMIAAYEQYSDRVEFFAVAVGVGQSPRSIGRHLRRHPMPIPILFDRKGAAVRAFMTPATSYIVVLDAEGHVAYTGIGPDQDIDAAIRSVIGQ